VAPGSDPAPAAAKRVATSAATVAVPVVTELRGPAISGLERSHRAPRAEEFSLHPPPAMSPSFAPAREGKNGSGGALAPDDPAADAPAESDGALPVAGDVVPAEHDPALVGLPGDSAHAPGSSDPGTSSSPSGTGSSSGSDAPTSGSSTASSPGSGSTATTASSPASPGSGSPGSSSGGSSTPPAGPAAT
jgi:hypothetical protein